MFRIPRLFLGRAIIKTYSINSPYRQPQNIRFFSLFPLAGKQLGPQPPELYIEGPDGIDRKIFKEDDLYRYTRHRWLFNEQNELSKRYLKFNLRQLIETAVSVIDGARYYTKVLKCSEGLHNKAFILTMDNGTELFAKLPNPNAGPTQYTTASEVATHELLRDLFSIPVPRVLAWSSDAANPVETEYIITEKARGVRLGYLWYQWPREAKLKLIRQVADLESTLTTIRFPRHGCIYFKGDLRSLTGDAEDLIFDSAPEAIRRFSIGPLTSAELWKGTRKDMESDRGPWQDPCEYAKALGRNEMTWIKSHASPRMNYHRSCQEHELPDDGLALLTQYVDVACYLVPSSTDEVATSNVLWHPDLHLDNVFVDPETNDITSIVDWQSACVAPLFYQSNIPRMFKRTQPIQEEGWVIPERPENFNELSQDEQKKINNDIESEIMHKYYAAQVCKRAPYHWTVLQQPMVPMIRKPVWLVSGAWENKDLFFLRQSLIELATHWNDIFPELPCPIKFTEKDIELHSKEEENMDGVGQILALFRDQGVLPVDGMVDPKDYETACENSRKLKDIFIGLAKDEAERELFTKLWPYQEPEA